MLSEKLQPTVLVIPFDQKTSRLYNLQRTNKSTAARVFRCDKCRSLNRESPLAGHTFAVLIRVSSQN